ncbi:MAG TPA: aminotransferase class IV, partial [Clostridiaceae bacterium]|nr:aminotransferase class IV [Clostridiaceae bacterium]
MEKEITGKYVISGDTIISTDEFDFNLTKKVPGVYEVIRIIDGVPLFFEKHMDRFAS